MMSYTVCLLICRRTNRVLLIKKCKTDFAGMYNGIGGKFEAGETAEMCAVREIKEESGVNAYGRLVRLGTLWLPDDCGEHDPEGCFLHFFAVEVEEEEVLQQPGEVEPLRWFNVDKILNMPAMNSLIAGKGDVQMFLAWAVEKLESTVFSTIINH